MIKFRKVGMYLKRFFFYFQKITFCFLQPKFFDQGKAVGKLNDKRTYMELRLSYPFTDQAIEKMKNCLISIYILSKKEI